MNLFKRKTGQPEPALVAKRAKIFSLMLTRNILCPPPDMLDQMRSGNAEWTGIKTVLDQHDAEVASRLRSENLWDSATKRERSLFERNMTDASLQERVDATWLAESLHVLLWSLKVEEKLLPYDTERAPDDIVKTGLELDVRSAALRPMEEIEKQRSIAELWHWRSRTRWLIENQPDFTSKLPPGLTIEEVIRMSAEKLSEVGAIESPIEGDFPVLGKPYRELTQEEWSQAQSITMERHKALNWLAGYAPKNDWDQTPTDT